MRILVHDFGGYAFALQLSCALARRGHTVSHAYCASLQTTPPGVSGAGALPATLTVTGLKLSAPLNKYALVTRWRQERAFGRLVARHCQAFKPDIVLSGNAPLSAQAMLMRACRRADIPFVYWLQDLLGVATYRILRNKHTLLSETVGRYYRQLEGRLLRRSAAVVGITEDFLPIVRARGASERRLTVIENWANLDELPVRPKANAWAQAHGLADKTCLLYAGTLSMKHNPDLLLNLAHTLKDDATVRVVVISQGIGMDYLQRRGGGLDNLILMGYQPKQVLPDVLGAADVLLAVLEPDAGSFSVPSKVLTYLCAQRPVLLAVPPTNLAARLVTHSRAGSVVAPDDAQGFADAAALLARSAPMRAEMGSRARAYAEATFDITRIADRFLDVFAGVAK